MPSPSSTVFRPLWPVQASAHTLPGLRWISALPAAKYCQKQSCFEGLRMEKGRHRQEEAKAKAVQSSYRIKMSGNKRHMWESTITHLTGQASVNHHLGKVKISTAGAQRKPTWQTHPLNGKVKAAGAFKPPQPKEHGEGRGTPGAQSNGAQ